MKKIKFNIEYVLKDKNGELKLLFNLNKLGNFLLNWGIKTPQIWPFGFWANSMKIHNLITNTGMAGVASRINGNGAEAVFNYIAIGIGTTAANVADTTLESEITTGGGARTTATCTRVTTDVANDTAQMSKTFSITATFAVTESGVLNAAAAGVLLNRNVFSAINVVNGDSLTLTHKFDID